MAIEHVTPTRDELLDELASELIVKEIPENAISVKMLAEQSGRHENTCRHYLERKVRDGKMDCVVVGATRWYYPKGICK